MHPEPVDVRERLVHVAQRTELVRRSTMDAMVPRMRAGVGRAGSFRDPARRINAPSYKEMLMVGAGTADVKRVRAPGRARQVPQRRSSGARACAPAGRRAKTRPCTLSFDSSSVVERTS